MNGNGRNEDVKMEEVCKGTSVYMWGYLPGVTPEKSPIFSPVPVRFPEMVHGGGGGESWKDVCGGGYGFAMAISGSGKLITWGSADDEGQSYLTCGKHGGTPESFLLPSESPVVKAAAGWAHCISVTEAGEVYAWGWKECVPCGTLARDSAVGGSIHKDTAGKQSTLLSEEVCPKYQSLSLTGGPLLPSDSRKAGEETAKRRKMSTAKGEFEQPALPGDEFFAISPSLVNVGPGVRITSVAAGGRHTLALSDMGQVWGWGYGGEGQLGLGSRIKMVSSPHLIPCIELSTLGKDMPLAVRQGSMNSSAQTSEAHGNYVKEIACGGRHSAVITDTGALLTFGWGLYGQCGQGSTNDQLRPSCIPSLLGIRVKQVAAGLWHTLCITTTGHVYAFGGNQFGQLGTGADQAETQPRHLDAPSLENKNAKVVSCGARHSAILTDDSLVFCWGWNKYGQLGLGDAIDRNIPSQVPIESSCQPTNIACGWWHTLLLAE